MKEVIIRYNNPRTLQILKSIAKYFDFSIASSTGRKSTDELEYINSVPYTPGDASIDIAGLSGVFTGKNLNASTIRKNEWQRQK